jgi:hypothetical protein
MPAPNHQQSAFRLIADGQQDGAGRMPTLFFIEQFFREAEIAIANERPNDYP